MGPETPARAGEVVAMQVIDLNLRSVPPTAIIRRGKGGKGRVVPLAVEAAAAIDEYMRARRTHRLKDDPALWLGDRGKHFSYDALHKTLAMCADMAGVPGFHLHRLVADPPLLRVKSVARSAWSADRHMRLRNPLLAALSQQRFICESCWLNQTGHHEPPRPYRIRTI